MTATLYLPRLAKPPYQTIIHFPSPAIEWMPPTNYFGFQNDRFNDTYARAGRAWVLPSLKCSYYRKPAGGACRMTDSEHVICWFKDVMRTIDYLQTRSEFDTGKLAYEGLSASAAWAPVLPAIEHRFKAVVMWGGTLRCSLADEFSHFNFAPRVHVPFFLQNGRYDPYATDASMKRLMDLLSTAPQDKQYKLYDSGHCVWIAASEARRDEMAFLDRYFGTNSPVK